MRTKSVFLVIILILIALNLSFANVESNEIIVKLNGEKLSFDVAPKIVNGRTLVPVKVIFESLGLSVSWNETTREVIGNNNKVSVKLRVNETKAYINESLVMLDVPATIINGRTLVPLKFIAESTGAEVKWDGLNKVVLIDTYNRTVLDPTNSLNSKFPPLQIQGYTVDTLDYIALTRNNYKVKTKILENVGFKYSKEQVKDGYIDVEEYYRHYTSLGAKFHFGLNGDGFYILYRPDYPVVTNKNIPNYVDGSLNSQIRNETTVNIDGYAINLIKEFSRDYYDGKHVGSKDNKDLAYMIYGEAFLLGANPKFIEYQVNVAESNQNSLKIDGLSLIPMVDFMPNSSAKTSFFKGSREIVYIGSGQTISDFDVNGKAVIFTWNDINGKFPSGIMDRYQKLISSGATEVFIIANGEMPIGYFEHPLVPNEVGYIQYISQDAAEKYFGLTDLGKIGFKKSIFLEYSFKKDILSKTAYNVVATVNGVVDEEIVFVTNYDGWGHLGDISYSTVSYDTVAPITMLRLIDFYTENKPYYTIKFAFVGDKWTNQVGMEALLSHLSNDKIKTFIDLYALGGSSSYSEPFISKNIKSDAGFIERVLTDFGNALSSKISQKGFPSILIRGKGTNVGDVTKPNQDTFENYNINKFNSEFDFIKSVIDRLDGDYKIQPVNYALSGVDVNIYGKVYKNVKTKFVDVFYNEKYVEMNKIDLDLLNYIDEVYLHVAKLNHYTKLDNKVKFYIDESSEFIMKNGLMWTRPGGYNMPYADERKEAVYSNVLVLANFAHELNHVVNHIHTDSVLGYGITNNQIDEVQGKSFMSLFLPNEFTNRPHTHKDFLKKYSDHHENGTPLLAQGQLVFDFRDIDKNYGFTFNGKFYNSDQIEGTIVDFIADSYGYNKARSFVMKAFSTTSNERYTSFIEKELELSYSELIDQFYKWFNAKGEYKINKDYDDNLTDYDYQLFNRYMN